ncbi:MAG: hypothetical protein IJX59_05285 [Clostridia bacterium]|nr:hypothetical protein [Clostridia bacterium]
MNKKEPKSFSQRFDKKYVLLTLMWLALLALSIVLMVVFINHDIFGVFFAFTSVAAFIMVVVSYRRAVLTGTVEEGMVLIFIAIGKMFNFILLPVVKLLTKL